MNWFTGIIVYVSVWWVALFVLAVLAIVPLAALLTFGNLALSRARSA